MEERVQQLERQVQDLQFLLFKVIKSDKYYFDRKLYLTQGMSFSGDFALEDGTNITTGTTNGSKIGGSASAKVSVYNATPLARQAAINAPSGGGTSSTDAIDISARARINDIRTALTNFGITS